MSANTDGFPDVRFHVHPDFDSVPDDGRFLFNQRYYLQNQPTAGLVGFTLRHARSHQTVALLYLRFANGQAVSPWRGTFGGIEAAPGITAGQLDFFVREVNRFADLQNINSISMTNHPAAYQPAEAPQVTAALLRNGYEIRTTDTNYHIAITPEPLDARMHASERRRLRKCHAANMALAEEAKPDLAAIHSFIGRARRRKGFRMPMELTAFEEMFRNMPDVYRVFTVRQGNTIAALAVTIRINEDILYNFYPADNEDFLLYSPTVLLTDGLYKVAQREGYRMLDLGIATDNGAPNHGLMRFKRHLGGEESGRLCFVREKPMAA